MAVWCYIFCVQYTCDKWSYPRLIMNITCNNRVVCGHQIAQEVERRQSLNVASAERTVVIRQVYRPLHPHLYHLQVHLIQYSTIHIHCNETSNNKLSLGVVPRPRVPPGRGVLPECRSQSGGPAGVVADRSWWVGKDMDQILQHECEIMCNGQRWMVVLSAVAL